MSDTCTLLCMVTMVMRGLKPVITRPIEKLPIGVFQTMEGVSCPCVPPRHALCVKTQGHRDAQGRSLGNALEMAKK